MKKRLFVGLWLLSFCLPALAYKVDWSVFVTAGGEATGGNWGLVSSVGQSICGKSEGGGYSCEGGFLSGTGTGILQIGSITAFIAIPISPALVRLSWNDITDEGYYLLKRNDIASFWQLTKDTKSYDDTHQLKAETPYTYTLTAYNATDTVLATATATTTTPPAKHNFIPYHNLFHPTKGEKVSIYYKIENSGLVTIKLYNLAGEMVRTLVDENKGADQYWIDWEGKNDEGSLCAAGVYIIQIKIGDFKKSEKIILIK
ncbi:T9SS type A sorting domain-containing protein [bacterium]|nr:T9SS type A sorting domain-containing protein [bacterium]MBU1598505.1 T9SS type A sorting domain-containing protein [bacterium]